MNEWLWFVSRAMGVVSLVLLTTTVVLGVVGPLLGSGRRIAVLAGLHRNLGLGLVVFLAAHIVTAVVETYVDISWPAALVPFTSGYERLWVGLGTLAFDLMLAVVATSLLRHRLPERLWRSVHYSTWLLWAIAVVHGFAMSTADQPLLRGSTIGCGVIGLAAAVLWATRSTRDSAQRQLVAAQEWS